MLAKWGGNNYQFIIVDFANDGERDQIIYSLSKKERKHFIKSQKFGKRAGTGIVRFIDSSNRISSGLWKILYDVCKNFNIKLEFKNFDDLYLKIDKEQVYDHCRQTFGRQKITPDENQILSVYKSLKYRFSSLDLSVSAGKTLIAYLQASLLKKLGISKMTLIITIKPSLVMQIYKEFVDFNNDQNFNITFLHGETKNEETEGYDVVIANFQYLQNKPDEFFLQFEAILIDEGHRITAGSVRNAINKCRNHKWRCGSSGSIREEFNTAEYFNFLCFTGPTVHKVSKRTLIDSGRAADGDVVVFKLNYANESVRRSLYMAKGQMEGDKLLNLEKQIVRASKKRFDWIIKLIKNFSDKNILVYFEDVKGGYGKRLYERIKEESENIGVYYIDESVPASAREYFKKKLEETSGNVLFATWQTWSTGESVKNLHVVICAEPVKDEVILSQGMGRPMRLHSSKDKFLWIDIVDDLSVQVLKKDESGFETFQNYFNKWLSFRLKYYEKEFFQVKITKIDLTKL